MASTNHTDNYNLPQWIGTDKPTWLGDVNGAFSTIDTTMKATADNLATARTDIDTNSGSIVTLQQTSQTQQGSIDDISTRLSTVENNVSRNTSNITTNTNNITTINGRLGNVNISGIGDDTVTGAIRNLNDNLGYLLDTDSQTVNVTSSSITSITSLTLTPGVWSVTAYCSFASNSSGIRSFSISTSATAHAPATYGRISMVPSGSLTAMGSVTKTFVVGDNTPIYLTCGQSSGSTLAVSGRLVATKLRGHNAD